LETQFVAVNDKVTKYRVATWCLESIS